LADDDPKPVVWVGDSRKQVQGFPPAVRQDIGSALFDVQIGDTPPAAKLFKGVGRGVFEIVTHFDTDTYRTVYAVQIGKRCISCTRFKRNPPGGSEPRSRISL